MDAWERLSTPIRHYIYSQHWTRLRPIQEAAILMASSTQDNLILAAPTASGKTEAAYLPALSFPDIPPRGLRILAISPLIALINDQFRRVSELCRHLDIPVTAWHGEASQTQKNKLLQDPRGILIITPESLEAMLDRHPERAAILFRQLNWILVDELHSFLEGPRGIQLRSLLYRIQAYSENSPRYIGMSATIPRANYEDAKAFFPSPRETRILLDTQGNSLVYDIHLHRNDIHSAMEEKVAYEDPSFQNLCEGIFEDARHEKMLVFPNSRARVEMIAQALQDLASDHAFPLRVFAHHSSIEKKRREAAEAFVKHAQNPFVLCATSTLELGIDIGTVDSVTQVGAPFSATSLSQRLGRSGRSEIGFNPETGRPILEPSRLHLRLLDDWGLLQALAALGMVKRGELDRQMPTPKPYDILAHQILALVLERFALPVDELYRFASEAPVWRNLDDDEIAQVIEGLFDQGYLELVEGENEAIIGREAEPITNHYDFYALFQSTKEFDVIYGREKIGTLPPSPAVLPGSPILLAARIWEVIDINERSQKIRVIPAYAGRAPIFFGNPADVTQELRLEMLRILHNPPQDVLDNPELLASFQRLQGETPHSEPIQFIAGDPAEEALVLFLGTRQERALYLLLRATFGPGTDPKLFWSPYFARIFGNDLPEALNRLALEFSQTPDLSPKLKTFLLQDRKLRALMLGDIKYAQLLSDELQVKSILYNLCDLSIQQSFSAFLKQNWRPHHDV